jgi:hypothetical protein
MGGLGILSYKTVAPHAYAAASEAADVTLAPVLTPESPPASTQPTTQHQRCQDLFAGNKKELLGSLTMEQAKADVEASSKLGRSGSPPSYSSPPCASPTLRSPPPCSCVP